MIMWMTIGIILILLNGVYIGTRRGLMLQLVLTIGFALSYYFAGKYYVDVANYLKLLIPYPQASLNDSFVFYNQTVGLRLDGAFYNGLSFLVILFIGWLATRFVGGLLNGVTYLPVIKQVNQLGGAVLGGLVTYIALFLLLFILTMLPIDFIQEQFGQSSFARSIVENTPRLTHQIYDWWISSSF